MDDLSVRLEALLRRYAAAINRGGDDTARLVDEFRASLGALVAEFGQLAIDAALTKIRDEASSSVALH
jgi:hypothetical protein